MINPQLTPFCSAALFSTKRLHF